MRTIRRYGDFWYLYSIVGRLHCIYIVYTINYLTVYVPKVIVNVVVFLSRGLPFILDLVV